MRNLEIKNIDCHAALAMTKNAQSGRSMIEMLGVLAIIGVLSVGGIAGYSKAMQKYRINKTIEQITLIAGNVRTFFAPQRNYAGLTSLTDNGKKIIKKAKLVPDEMWNSAGTALENAWGGKLGVMGSANYIVDWKHYEYKFINIIFEDIPIEACIEITTQDWSSLNMVGVSLNAADRDESGSIFSPIDIATATEKCAKLGSPANSVGLTLQFEGF